MSLDGRFKKYIPHETTNYINFSLSFFSKFREFFEDGVLEMCFHKASASHKERGLDVQRTEYSTDFSSNVLNGR